MTDVERRFVEAMFAIYSQAREIGYTPNIFLRMLHEKGALQTARQLISASQPSDGYTRLWELERLDLSVEAVVHDSTWNGTNYSRRMNSRDVRSGWRTMVISTTVNPLVLMHALGRILSGANC